MITVSKATSEEIKEFNNQEWIAADLKYYGKTSGWIKEKYAFKAAENGKIAIDVINEDSK